MEEERVLTALYASIRPTEAGHVLGECLSSIFGDANASGAPPVCSTHGTGTWSRVVILVRRACDKRLMADVDGTQKKALEAALLGAIASPHVAKDTHAMAVLLTLSRVLFQMGRLSDVDEDVERGYREYDRWLMSVLNTVGKPAVKALCTVLTELIPVETLRYLRSNTKAFARRREFSDIAGNCLLLSRTRIRDLDPKFNGAGAVGMGSRGGVAAPTAKAVADVAKFVTEFTRGGNKIPASLVRQMNFHRYHFRSNTLDSLLLPEFEPPPEVLDREFVRGGLESFTAQRVAMIKVLAFKRQDRALTKAEAEMAIAKIGEVSKRRRIERLQGGRPNSNPVAVTKEALSEQSSFQELLLRLSEILGPSIPPEEGQTIEFASSGAEAPVGELNGVEKIFCAKLASLCGGDASSRCLADAAAHLVHASLGQIVADLPAGHASADTSPSSSRESSCDLDRGRYQMWWSLCSPMLGSLLGKVLRDGRVSRMRKAFQSQCFALVCIQSHTLIPGQVAGMAMLMYAITSLSGNSALQDLCYLCRTGPAPSLSHIVTAIADCLPLGCPRLVRRSAQFALHYLMFVLSNNHEPKLADVPPLLQKTALPTSATQVNEAAVEEVPSLAPIDSQRTAEGYLPVSLVRIIQWVLCAPWRLWVSRYGSEEYGASSEETEEAITLLAEGTSILHDYVLRTVRVLPVEKWVRVETRAGWGRPGAVAEALHRFSSSAATPTQIIATVSCVVASTATEVSKDPSASWIVVGLTEFAASISWPLKCVDSSPKSQGSATWAMHRFVEACLKKQGLVVGRAMIGIISLLPSVCHRYFHGSRADAIDAHIRNFIGLVAWPFSAPVTNLVLCGIARSDSVVSRENTASMRRPQVSVVAALAVHWDTLKASGCLSGLPDTVEECVKAGDEPVGGHYLNIVSEARAVRLALRHLAPTNGQGAVSDVDEEQRNGNEVLAHAALCSPHALAVAIVHSIAYARHSGSSGGYSVQSVFQHLATQVAGNAAAEVLDAMLQVAAHVPLMRSAMLCLSDCLNAASWSQVVLIQVVEARLGLTVVAQPNWLSVGHGQSAPISGLNYCNFVSASQLSAEYGDGHDPPSPTPVYEDDENFWFLMERSDTFRLSGHMNEEVCNVLARGRIAQAIGAVGKETLCFAVEASSADDRDSSLPAILVQSYIDVVKLDVGSSLGKANGQMRSCNDVLSSFRGHIEEKLELSIRRVSSLPEVRIQDHVRGILQTELRQLNPTLWDECKA